MLGLNCFCFRNTTAPFSIKMIMGQTFNCSSTVVTRDIFFALPSHRNIKRNAESARESMLHLCSQGFNIPPLLLAGVGWEKSSCILAIVESQPRRVVYCQLDLAVLHYCWFPCRNNHITILSAKLSRLNGCSRELEIVNHSRCPSQHR